MAHDRHLETRPFPFIGHALLNPNLRFGFLSSTTVLLLEEFPMGLIRQMVDGYT